MKICTAQSVRAAEQTLFSSGRMTSLELMNAVVERLWRACCSLPLLRHLAPARVVVYAGTGNNAGDAIGLAARWGCPVTLRCAGELSADAAAQLSGREERMVPEPQERLLIIDGLLGSGAVGALRPGYAKLVREMNALRAASPRSLLLSIDIPTGLDAASGKMEDDVVLADVTAAIGCVKPGMLADGAEDAVGRLLCIPLPEVGPLAEADAAQVAEWQPVLPRRAYSCFKNRAGRVAVVAGSPGMAGAAQMCAEAALAAGAGLVVLYCLPPVYPVLAARVAPEIMVRQVGSYADIQEEQAQALVVGPGLGQVQPVAAENLRRLVSQFAGTVVLDADGLNTAAAWGWKPAANWVLTPHPGEMDRLFPEGVGMKRREKVSCYRDRYPCTLLLKGARTIIAGGDGCFYNATGGPYMANGGQGDVLSGVVGALAAQGLPALQAAVAGACACGLAAERAWASGAYPRSVTATQVIRHLPSCLA